MPNGDANENSRKKSYLPKKQQQQQQQDSALFLFFSSKSPGGHAIYRQNARVLEMWNFTSAYIWRIFGSTSRRQRPWM